MRTEIESIAHRRQLCIVILRSISLVLFLAGALAAGLAVQSRMGRYSGFEYLILPILSLLGAFWVPAAVLGLASRSLARWVVPIPRPASECPQCGYSLQNINAPICPECGLTLRSIEPPKPAAAQK